MEAHAVISVARVNFRARKLVEMEGITVQIINEDLSNSDSQHKYDDIGMWLIFFVGRPSYLIRSCSPWTAFLHLKRSTQCWYFLQFRKSPCFEYNAGISIRNLPDSWPNRKPEHLHFKASKGSRRHSFSSYVLKCPELDGEHAPTYVYLSLIHFNQGSSKLVPCVFSVNWFLLSFRFQRMLEAPSKDVGCQNTYQNKSFF